jgi:hypothetical protein
MLRTEAYDRPTAANWRRTIFDVVDEAYFARGNVPPGTVGRMFRALDTMRMQSVEAPIVARAEAIAVALHKLLMTMQAAPNDERTVMPIRRELRMMGVDWLKEMPLFQ